MVVGFEWLDVGCLFGDCVAVCGCLCYVGGVGFGWVVVKLVGVGVLSWVL